MRVNRYLAACTGISRRAADEAITAGRVKVAGQPATLGQVIDEGVVVTLDGIPLEPIPHSYALLYKPVGYITSRHRQGKTPTIYELLPQEIHHLKPVGRLDKDSCGLLLLTNDGELTQALTHPSGGKLKTYRVRLNYELKEADLAKLKTGVELDDGPSRLDVRRNGGELVVKLMEGRNRQIRRTFDALRYKVTYLERTAIGGLSPKMKRGQLIHLKKEQII